MSETLMSEADFEELVETLHWICAPLFAGHCNPTCSFQAEVSLQEHHHISAGESFLITLSSLTPPLYWPPEVQDEWFLQQLSHLDLPPKHLTLLVDVRGHVIRPHTPMVTKGSGLKQAVEEEPVQSAVSNAWVNTVALVDFGFGCRRNFMMGVCCFRMPWTGNWR